MYSNTASSGGGVASSGGNPRLYNNTFVSNTATITGGALYLAAGRPAISNTIVASNTNGGTGAAPPSPLWGEHFARSPPAAPGTISAQTSAQLIQTSRSHRSGYPNPMA